MSTKMIVTDLDNTLLRSDKTISDYTVGVFERCRKRGIKIAFATSRSEQSSHRYSARIAPDAFVSNGGAIARVGETTVYCAPLPLEIVHEIIAACVAEPHIAQITVDASNGYFNSKPIHLEWSGWEDYIHSQTVNFAEPIDYGDVYKVYVLSDTADAVARIIAERPDLGIWNGRGEDWYQIKRSDVNKAVAVEQIAKHLHIPLSEIAAFGDDSNDLEMLRECGVGVAVANALDEVKAAADYICGICDDDGVAKWLEVNVLA